ncbi:hypothetical protein NCAS_0A13050 [Naumovozyma castellii]|uniref:DNA repair protein RAD7 n=1 Tax=Naumovozyma castellii TaxID=27288 RepID=G0V8R4_NAUCA|nr:hypothetical protein NCAS_0A13050 [Naumovozyma castellii CBS 4309]CCC67863.1 hypothetical protein NCAS_0A13050 [Naumovozyma castellii CBS 4309]
MIYRGRNRSSRNNIKGPNSALTQFLQEEGISAETIRKRWLKQQEDKEKEDVNKEVDTKGENSQTESDENPNPVSLNVSDEEDVNESTPSSIMDRVLQVAQDSDEEEYESLELTPVPLEVSGKKENEVSKRKRTTEVLKTRQRKKKRAAKLLDRSTTNIMSLQNLCIMKISDNIKEWQRGSDSSSSTLPFSRLREVFGGISNDNLVRLAKALSKNRALDDQTLQLFLKTDIKDITFHDCSKISFEGYKTLAIFSPHLTKLSLQMCGQLNNEALLYIAEKLPALTSLSVDGPFLINEATWDAFFICMKGRLREFHISNTHRFSDASLSSLLRNCGSSLNSLGLSRMDSVSNYSLIPQYLTNSQFNTLSIQYPFNEEDVTDEVVINILGQVGKSLTSLVLDGCLELTDSVIINGMCAFLSGDNDVSGLKKLSLEDLEEITDDSLVYLFSKISFPNLERCSLKRCLQLSDMAVIELLLNSANKSLKSLNLNSLKNLTKEAFLSLSCPNLEYLDISFVRCINDKIIETIGKQNLNLKLVDVFGDNLITEKAEVINNLTLVGRQCDSI